MKDSATKIYALVASAILMLYLATEARGIVFGGTDEEASVPPTARSAGYRAPGFWYTGYHGGK